MLMDSRETLQDEFVGNPSHEYCSRCKMKESDFY